MPMKKQLAAKDRDELLGVLKARFEKRTSTREQRGGYGGGHGHRALDGGTISEPTDAWKLRS
jgi:hypothetical protein